MGKTNNLLCFASIQLIFFFFVNDSFATFVEMATLDTKKNEQTNKQQNTTTCSDLQNKIKNLEFSEQNRMEKMDEKSRMLCDVDGE